MKGEETEKAYSTIGTSSENKTSSHEGGNHTDEGSAVAEDGSGAGAHLEKHAELMNKTIIDYVYQSKLNSTAVRRNQVDLSYKGGKSRKQPQHSNRKHLNRKHRSQEKKNQGKKKE